MGKQIIKSRSCIFRNCDSNSRFRHLPHMKNVTFKEFANPKVDLEKAQRWIHASGIPGFTTDMIQCTDFVCSKHFVGENGPNALYPDPLPFHIKYTNVIPVTNFINSVPETLYQENEDDERMQFNTWENNIQTKKFNHHQTFYCNKSVPLSPCCNDHATSANNELNIKASMLLNDSFSAKVNSAVPGFVTIPMDPEKEGWQLDPETGFYTMKSKDGTSDLLLEMDPVTGQIIQPQLIPRVELIMSENVVKQEVIESSEELPSVCCKHCNQNANANTNKTKTELNQEIIEPSEEVTFFPNCPLCGNVHNAKSALNCVAQILLSCGLWAVHNTKKELSVSLMDGHRAKITLTVDDKLFLKIFAYGRMVSVKHFIWSVIPQTLPSPWDFESTFALIILEWKVCKGMKDEDKSNDERSDDEKETFCMFCLNTPRSKRCSVLSRTDICPSCMYELDRAKRVTLRKR